MVTEKASPLLVTPVETEDVKEARAPELNNKVLVVLWAYQMLKLVRDFKNKNLASFRNVSFHFRTYASTWEGGCDECEK
jgi:hypothetical protein